MTNNRLQWGKASVISWKNLIIKKSEALPTWLVTTLINREKIKKETSLIEVSLENKTVEEGETYSRPHSDCVCTYVPVDGNAGGIV